jgi:hypothetical protein
MEIITLLWPSVHSYLTDMELDMPSLTDSCQSVQGIGTYNADSLISWFFGRYSNIITTDAVSSNLDQGEVHNIMW